MNSRHAFIGCFIVVCLMITWQELKNCHALPFPTRLIATGVVFGLLDIASGLLGSVALVVGVGYTVAIAICTVAPNKTCTLRLNTTSDCNAYLASATSQPSSYQALAPAQVPAGETLA